jgi:hypothetical protein
MEKTKQILIDQSILRAVTDDGFDQLVTDIYNRGQTWEQSFYEANELYFATFECERFSSYDSWRVARAKRLKKIDHEA